MTRRYLLSTAAGTAAVSLAVPVFAQRRSTELSAVKGDPVLEEITRQLERAAMQMQAAPRSETARQLAAATRMWAAWAAANQFDDSIRSGLRAAIARDGRDAVLAREFDFSAEAKLRGFKLPPNTPSVSRAARSQVLDEMLRSGVSGGLRRLASVWEAAAPVIDRRFGAFAPVAARQQNVECESANAALIYAKTMAFFLCLPPAIVEPAGPGICGIAVASILGLEWYIWYLGC
jgi:hypothetical protein